MVMTPKVVAETPAYQGHAGRTARTGRVFWQRPMSQLSHAAILHRQSDARSVMINNMMAVADGAIKTFALRGVKDNPPYLHDKRLLAPEDLVEPST